MPEVRLIDANAAADKIMRDIETHADEIGIGAVAIMIAFARALSDETDFPTVEPEMKRAYWEPSDTGEYHCTHCGIECDIDEFHKALLKTFCGNCGAKMVGE